MSSKKTPTSSLSTTELFANRVWYRSQARIRGMRSGGPSPETLPTCLSPATRLPQEIVETIIAYLIYDMRSLFACSRNCYSWYIAAVPHLHRALVIWDQDKDRNLPGFDSIQHMHRLGLLPLVKELRILGDFSTVGISQKLFNSRILHQFTAFANVRDLRLVYLNIPSFMPHIQRYFGHFLPTLKSLTLAFPKGSHQQVIFFIGLFQHLEDLMFHDDTFCTSENSEEGSSLVPLFVPPLGGRLVVWHVRRVGLLKTMIDSFGGFRFSRMNIFGVAETQLLLSVGARTLRILQLQQTDPHAKSSLLDFDLSRIESLQELETKAASIGRAPLGIPDRSIVLKHALSTVRSPEFSRVAIVYQEHDFYGIGTEQQSQWPHLHEMSLSQRACGASQHRKRFRLLREMHQVRNFRSVLCVNVWGPVGEYAVQVLEEAVAVEGENGVFGGSFSKPLVTYVPRWDFRYGVFP